MVVRRLILKILKVACVSILAAPGMSSGASAQAYPSHAVRLVVPFSAGSITDNLARILADRLSASWGQQVIVENRPGLPGTASVATSAPDGHTLMLTSNGHTIASALNKNLQFDPVRDFAAVTQVAVVPLVMIVPPDLPVRSVQDFIALAKQRPGQLNFSSAGLASTTFLAAELFRQNAGIELQHIPYRGLPEATNAVIRGDAHLFFCVLSSARELAAAGTVKALGITSEHRVKQMPNVPTIAESGLPLYKHDSWFGIMAPARTPSAVLQKASQDIRKVLALPEVAELLDRQGFVPAPTSPEEFDRINKADTERYGKILREAGVEAK